MALGLIKAPILILIAAIQGIALPTAVADSSFQSKSGPVGRFGSVLWEGIKGENCLFGGAEDQDARRIYEDVWCLDPKQQRWNLVAGSTSFNVPLNDEDVNKDIPKSPGSRFGSSYWVLDNGTLVLYSGKTVLKNGSFAILDDLWSFDPVNFRWSCIRSTDDSKRFADELEFGISLQGDTRPSPGGRLFSAFWTNSNQEAFLFGGYKNDPTNALNDLWKFNVFKDEWIKIYTSKFSSDDDSISLPSIGVDTIFCFDTIKQQFHFYSVQAFSDSISHLWTVFENGSWTHSKVIVKTDGIISHQQLLFCHDDTLLLVPLNDLYSNVPDNEENSSPRASPYYRNMDIFHISQLLNSYFLKNFLDIKSTKITEFKRCNGELSDFRRKSLNPKLLNFNFMIILNLNQKNSQNTKIDGLSKQSFEGITHPSLTKTSLNANLLPTSPKISSNCVHQNPRNVINPIEFTVNIPIALPSFLSKDSPSLISFSKSKPNLTPKVMSSQLQSSLVKNLPSVSSKFSKVILSSSESSKSLSLAQLSPKPITVNKIAPQFPSIISFTPTISNQLSFAPTSEKLISNSPMALEIETSSPTAENYRSSSPTASVSPSFTESPFLHVEITEQKLTSSVKFISVAVSCTFASLNFLFLFAYSVDSSTISISHKGVDVLGNLVEYLQFVALMGGVSMQRTSLLSLVSDFSQTILGIYPFQLLPDESESLLKRQLFSLVDGFLMREAAVDPIIKQGMAIDLDPTQVLINIASVLAAAEIVTLFFFFLFLRLLVFVLKRFGRYSDEISDRIYFLGIGSLMRVYLFFFSGIAMISFYHLKGTHNWIFVISSGFIFFHIVFLFGGYLFVRKVRDPTLWNSTEVFLKIGCLSGDYNWSHRTFFIVRFLEKLIASAVIGLLGNYPGIQSINLLCLFSLCLVILYVKKKAFHSKTAFAVHLGFTFAKFLQVCFFIGSLVGWNSEAFSFATVLLIAFVLIVYILLSIYSLVRAFCKARTLDGNKTVRKFSGVQVILSETNDEDSLVDISRKDQSTFRPTTIKIFNERSSAVQPSMYVSPKAAENPIKRRFSYHVSALNAPVDFDVNDAPTEGLANTFSSKQECDSKSLAATKRSNVEISEFAKTSEMINGLTLSFDYESDVEIPNESANEVLTKNVEIPRNSANEVHDNTVDCPKNSIVYLEPENSDEVQVEVLEATVSKMARESGIFQAVENLDFEQKTERYGTDLPSVSPEKIRKAREFWKDHLEKGGGIISFSTTKSYAKGSLGDEEIVAIRRQTRTQKKNRD